MKKISALVIFLFLLTNVSKAQDIAQIDATIQFYPNTFNTVTDLSDLITRDFSTEEQKIRAIYGWIINNVAYEPNEYKVFDYSFKNYRERNTKEEDTRNKTIERTLQKGIAVCEGYAMLFEKLCELQGIQNYLVRGDIKTSFDDIGRDFKRIHMWNVAYIEGKPFLFDATWGAGRYNQKFIKEPSFYWYKTPPKLFVKSHYPDLVEDAFIDFNFEKEDFASLPLVIKKELLIEDVRKPQNGVIYAEELGKEIAFLLKTEEPNTLSYAFNFGKREKINNFKMEEGILKFEIRAQPQSNLVIYIDDAPALAYKIE